MTKTSEFRNLELFCATSNFSARDRRGANAVGKIINCNCIDDLPEAVVDSAVRFLDAYSASEYVSRHYPKAVREVADLLDRIC